MKIAPGLSPPVTCLIDQQKSRGKNWLSRLEKEEGEGGKQANKARKAHMGKGGGGGGGCTPWRSKTSPLPCIRKMGTHHMKKAHTLFYTLSCWAEELHFFTQFRPFVHFWLLRSCAIYHSKFSFKYVKNWFYFSDIFLKKCLPPSPPPSPRLWQPKTSPPLEAFLTHAHMEIFFHPLYEKSGAHVFSLPCSACIIEQQSIFTCGDSRQVK